MRLLDRDHQAPDQPRHFVESSGVMIFQRPRKAGKTFVVAHRRHIARGDRRYGAFGMKDGHRIASRIEPAKQASCPNKTFWRPGRDPDVLSCRSGASAEIPPTRRRGGK